MTISLHLLLYSLTPIYKNKWTRCTYLLSLKGRLDIVSLVDLVLNGEAVAIPSESSAAMVAGHGGVSSHDVLDCSCRDVSIMGQTCCEWRSVIKGVWLPALA